MQLPRLLLLLFVVLVASCIFPARLHGQVAHLILQPDSGELLTGGQSYDETYTPENSGGFFYANVEQLTNGLPSFVDFIFGLFSPPHTTLDFATNQLGLPLLPGSYTDAQRAAFASTGHPGLDVSFNFVGGNTVMGDFVIQNAVFLADPNAQNGFRVISFEATFNQRIDNETATLHGTFSYSAVPEPSIFSLCSITVLLFALSRARLAIKGLRTPCRA